MKSDRIVWRVLTWQDQEDLHFFAEEILLELGCCRFWYDEDGNHVVRGLQGEERDEALTRALKQQDALGDQDYLTYENKELQQLTFNDMLWMPLDTVKKKYLKGVLTKARNILRNGTSGVNLGRVVSDEVPDCYLEDLLALRWREIVKIWSVHWDENRKKNGVKEEET